MTRTRALMVVLLVATASIALIDLSRTELVRPADQLLDFRVSYCAGAAVDAHADPYRVEPIRSCEHAHPIPLLARTPNLVLAWVLPGYDIAPLAALARLPFGVAAATYVLALCAALAGCAVLIARTTGTPLAYTSAALVLSAGLPSLVLGQIVPFELLALAATAAALQARRERLAGALGALTCIEPHVGLFVCVALAIAVPGARLSMAAAIAGLAALAVAVTGFAAQVTYVLQDLPLQALSEVTSKEQFSLAYVLSYAGLPVRSALAVGAASTVAMLFLATVLARLDRNRDVAYVVYLPAAAAIVGGTYVHLAQVALAIPAALLAVRDADSPRVRTAAAFALVLLAIPWPYPAILKQLLPAALLIVGVLTWYLTRGSMVRTLAAAACCWLVLIPIENHTTGPPPALTLARRPASELATISGAEATHAESTRDPVHFAVKIATWAGLLALMGSSAAVAARPARSPRPA